MNDNRLPATTTDFVWPESHLNNKMKFKFSNNKRKKGNSGKDKKETETGKEQYKSER